MKICMVVVSVSLNISFCDVILYIFFVHILISEHFYLSLPLFFLTLYDITIFTDHRFILVQ